MAAKIVTYEIWIEYPSLDCQPARFTVEKLCKFCPPKLAEDYIISRSEWDFMDNELFWAWENGQFITFDNLKPQVDQRRNALLEMETVIWELWSHSPYFTPVIKLCFEARHENS